MRTVPANGQALSRSLWCSALLLAAIGRVPRHATRSGLMDSELLAWQIALAASGQAFLRERRLPARMRVKLRWKIVVLRR